MKQKVRKAVFPAAGLGTRFLPATKSQPKEMIPLIDTPLIQYVVDEAVRSGIEHIIVVTGRGKNSIEDHFDIAYELEKILESRDQHELLALVRVPAHMVKISFIRQKEALGLGHAVLVAREMVGDEPFAVLLGDDLIDSDKPCLRQMIDIYDQHQGSVIAVQEVPKKEISSYGVIAPGKNVTPHKNERVYSIADLVEKPPAESAPSNLAIIGRYILEPSIFESLAETKPGRGGEIQLTDAMRGLIDRKQSIYGYRFEGKRHDAGNKMGYLKATVEFALKRPDLGEEFRQYLKTLDLN